MNTLTYIYVNSLCIYVNTILHIREKTWIGTLIVENLLRLGMRVRSARRGADLTQSISKGSNLTGMLEDDYLPNLKLDMLFSL